MSIISLVGLLSCRLTPPPHSQRLSSFSSTKPKFTNKTTLLSPTLPCKPLSKPFVISSSISPKNDVVDDDDDSNTSFPVTLLQEFKNLELRIQQIIKNSSSQSNNNATEPPLLLEGILQGLYTLGLKILELDHPKTSAVTKETSKLVKETRTKDKLLVVDPKPNQGTDSRKIDQLINDVVGLYYGILDPPYYLTGNFGPIREETPPTNDLVIDGKIPESINGMMLRVGPNSQYDPEADYRWLDGDGMVHGVRIKEGNATYVSRYVRTSRFLQEDIFGKAAMFKYGDIAGVYGLYVAFAQLLRTKLEVLDMSYGYTTSNVGLVYHNGMIMTLEDFGKPYVIHVKDDGDLETLGINDYNGKLDHNLTPHPKKDPETGELFTFGISQTPPYATYRVVSRDGSMSDPVPITVSGPTYMHDFGITKNYVIFMDNPYFFSMEAMLTNGDWIFSFDGTKKSRFGILPRYATNDDKIKWFEFANPFFVFHNANSWEEDGNKVVLICCKMEAAINPKTLMPYVAPVTCSTRKKNDPMMLTLPKLYKMTFNLSTGEATQEKLSEAFLDNPKINGSYMGRKSRYVYTTEMNSDSKLTSIIKFDLQSKGRVGELKLKFGENRYGSEPEFVPRQSSTPTAAEDDGYLLTFVHDEDAGNSYVYVIDAQTMKVVSTIKLPKRVPYGFHSIFVTEKQLEAQVNNTKGEQMTMV